MYPNSDPFSIMVVRLDYPRVKFGGRDCAALVLVKYCGGLEEVRKAELSGQSRAALSRLPLHERRNFLCKMIANFLTPRTTVLPPLGLAQDRQTPLWER